MLAYCLAIWAHVAVFFLLRDGHLHLFDEYAWVFALAPVLFSLRDSVLLGMAISGNLREWPGDVTFFFPWVVALVTFAVVLPWLRRRAQRPRADVTSLTH